MPIDVLSPAPAPIRNRRRTDTNALVVRWREHGERAARDELFHRYLPLARRLALRYANPHEPVEDLVQVAAVGLLGAIDRFDPCRGVRFPAFAVPTILGELKRYFRNTGWSAHVPRGAKEMALRVDRAVRQMTVETREQPRVDQVAQYLEVRPEDVLEGLEAGAAHYSISLDTPVRADEEDAVTLSDSIGRNDEGYGLVETRAAMIAAIPRLP
ncbi:MAG TPA: sigma-70 family RNA polymerase sigma factor, partial [Solirubrobacteraceae bacterium]|nr:sigma-70 family RNA polymerase sigma factor [Solirubrobacteraceae bacterium]